MTDQRKISGAAIVVAVQDQVSTTLEDEAVILHLRDGVYYSLNQVGASIWNLLQEARTITEIRNIILSEYEVEPQQCETDLLKLLQELADRNLIEVQVGTPL
jgi:hypothetical protein